MLQVEDPALPSFDKRQDPEVLQDFMRDYTTREIEKLRAYEQVKGYRF